MMAPTTFSASSIVQLWSQRTVYDFVSDTGMFGQMISSGVVRKLDDTTRSAGDQVTISFNNRITQAGFLGMQSGEGLANPLVYYTDKLYINQLRQIVENPAPFTIDIQRVNYNIPEDSYRMLSEWMKVRSVLGSFNQLAGNTATTLTWDGVSYTGTQREQLTGLNAAVAPSTTSGVTRIFRPNGDSTDQAVAADTAATAKLTDILNCELFAQAQQPYIRPLSESSEIKFHYYVHTQCYMDLINDTQSPGQFRDIQQSLITSGRGEGEIQRSFVYSQTRVFNSDKLPQGVRSDTSAAVANTRRNVFVGRDAAACAFGRGFGGTGRDNSNDAYGFVVKTDYTDTGNMQRIAMSGIFGIKKIVFNSNDEGVIVVTNYSAT